MLVKERLAKYHGRALLDGSGGNKMTDSQLKRTAGKYRSPESLQGVAGVTFRCTSTYFL